MNENTQDYYILTAVKPNLLGRVNVFLGGIPVKEKPDFKPFFKLISNFAETHKMDVATTINLFIGEVGTVAIEVASSNNKTKFIVDVQQITTQSDFNVVGNDNRS